MVIGSHFTVRAVSKSSRDLVLHGGKIQLTEDHIRSVNNGRGGLHDSSIGVMSPSLLQFFQERCHHERRWCDETGRERRKDTAEIFPQNINGALHHLWLIDTGSEAPFHREMLQDGNTMHRMLQICRGVSCSECANA